MRFAEADISNDVGVFNRDQHPLKLAGIGFRDCLALVFNSLGKRHEVTVASAEDVSISFEMTVNVNLGDRHSIGGKCLAN